MNYARITISEDLFHFRESKYLGIPLIMHVHGILNRQKPDLIKAENLVTRVELDLAHQPASDLFWSSYNELSRRVQCQTIPW